MEENTENHFEQFENKIISRRALLPLWIKIFCWIFMVIGVASIGCLIIGVLGNTANLSLYGFETYEPLSLIGLFLTAVMLLKGFTAFSLWFEKDYAIQLAKVDTILGIAICIVSMVVIPYLQETSGFTFRLELALLIPFYIKLNKIQEEWGY
jgi:hypothetical protein